MCNCPIPFLAQNDGESIGNLNYSWCQVSIMRMRGMEHNILSVAIFLSVNKKNAIVDGKCQKVAYFSSAMLRQNMQHLNDLEQPFRTLRKFRKSNKQPRYLDRF